MKVLSMFRALQHAAAQAFTPHKHLYDCAACRQILQRLVDRRMAQSRFGQDPWGSTPWQRGPSPTEPLEGYMTGGATICTPGGTITSNLGLCEPAPNEVGWAAAVANNFTILDTLFAVSGKLATANGGTGLASPAAGSLLVGAGGSPMTALSPGGASSFLISTGSAPIWSPAPQSNTIVTAENRTLSTYGDLATVGPSVTLTPSVTGNVLALVSATCNLLATSQIAVCSVELSGGNTLAASDFNAGGIFGAAGTDTRYAIRAAVAVALSGLANASTIFRMKYRSDGTGAASFSNRVLALIPF